MAQLQATTQTSSPKRKKKQDDSKIELWKKDPTGDELREMAEITEAFEEEGLEVDPEVIRRAVVNDNMPKYMTLIAKDLEEDRAIQREQDYFDLKQRKTTAIAS